MKSPKLRMCFLGFALGAGISVISLIWLLPCQQISLKTQISSKQPPEKYVVLSANRNGDYAFALPLTTLAWNRIGFRSLVILVGKEAEWEAGAIEQVKVRYSFIISTMYGIGIT